MEETLFAEFPEITGDDWKNTIIKDLKGVPFEKILWDTNEGFTLNPFYRKEDLTSSTITLNKQEIGWKITEPIIENNSLVLANSQAKKALHDGADALLFFSHEEGGLAYGVPLSDPLDLPRLLSGIDLTQTPIILSLANRTPNFSSSIRSLSKEAKQILADYDPFGTAILCGSLGATEEKSKSNLASLISSNENERFICVHSLYLRDSGSTVTQELSFALAWATEYLNILIEAGHTPKKAAESIWFWMGIGSDYFFEIAKFRAMRVLWSQVLNEYEPGLGDTHQTIIQASTTDFNFTAYDPHVNILRGTTAAMSAVIGGADFVHINPFDIVYKIANDFGARIARNSQLLLKHEAHLDKVADPASGSYYLETLTHNLADVAWKEFQTIEKQGGFHESILSGKMQDSVEKASNLKREEVTSRRQTLLGTNQYPLATERHPELSPLIVKTKSLLTHPNDDKYKRLNPLRLSWDFDRLRSATDLHIKNGKAAPKVFLLTIGNPAMRKARASFSLNFIACLGYEILDNAGFANMEAGISAAKTAKADIIVLCSSDDEYAELIPSYAILAKKELPEAWRIIAGYPKALIATAEENGIEDFIHLKRNVIEFMEKAQKKFGLLT